MHGNGNLGVKVMLYNLVCYKVMMDEQCIIYEHEK